MLEIAAPDKVRLVIACDDENYRNSIAAVLSLSPFVEIAKKSREGEEGAAYVSRIDPDVVILGVSPEKDCAADAAYYEECFRGELICFAFDEEQSRAYRAHGFERIATGGETRTELEKLICEAMISYRGSLA